MVLKYGLFLNNQSTKSVPLNEESSERYLGLPIQKECRNSDRVSNNIPLSTYIRINRLTCAGHVKKMEVYHNSKEIFMRKFRKKEVSRKTA